MSSVDTTDQDPHQLARRFGGVGRLYGQAAQQAFASAHIAIIGIGGVGSWVAEALARSGVGQLTLIDLDNVAISNTNRQVHALEGSFGQAKVDAMAARIHAIHPACRVHAVEDFLSPDNLAALLLNGPGGRPQLVIDAMDQVRTKAALVAWCRQQRLPLLVSGGAGGKQDPALITHGDLADTLQDPLLAKLRTLLRREHGFAKGGAGRMGVMCVYSTEPLQQATECEVDGSAGLNCAGYGSAVVVTATVGLRLAALALQRLQHQR